MKYSILPMPKQITEKSGAFRTESSDIAIVGDIDRRIVRKAAELQKLLCSVDSTAHKLSRDDNGSAKIIIGVDPLLMSEQYVLDISSSAVSISGGSAAGCFYGIVTLMQLINEYKNELPALNINDYPDFGYRGFYHDATRGRVPSVDGVKRIIDRLASMKINSFQLYVEQTFDFDEFKNLGRTDEDYLTAEDILEIDSYCYDNFIDFVPSLSTFGHLYELLQNDKYKHLCELDGFVPQSHFWLERMLHHTIDPSNPDSIKTICSLIDQYLPLFRSDYFNICCDETFDLCKGKNQGKDSGELYCGFVNKIIDHVTKMGKKVMMWGDIALAHEEALQSIPKDTVFLTWNYQTEPNLENIVKIKQSGYSQIICPGTNSWHSLIENIGVSVPNITKSAKYAFQNGAMGILNTNWGDFGHPASFECALYGASMGACLSWNTDTDINADFEQAVSHTVYGCNENIIPYIRDIAASQNNAPWIDFFFWNAMHKTDCFKGNASDAENEVKRCAEVSEKLCRLDGNKAVLAHLTNAARGVCLLNSAKAKILSGEPTSPLCDAAKAWICEYERLWLEGSKQSELREIRKFIMKICE